jgi:hypothetical protein
MFPWDMPLKTNPNKKSAVCPMLASCLAHSSILKMEAICSSETPVDLLWARLELFIVSTVRTSNPGLNYGKKTNYTCRNIAAQKPEPVQESSFVVRSSSKRKLSPLGEGALALNCA